MPDVYSQMLRSETSTICFRSVTEEVVQRRTRALAKDSGSANLCLAGGVALNCVANGKVLHDGAFENIWIQPAAGDASGALCAALAAYHVLQGRERHTNIRDNMSVSYLGPSYEDEEIQTRLEASGAKLLVLPEIDMIEAVANALAHGRSVGWFQGRMEFGPRTLGGRSILGTRGPRSCREI